MIKGFGWLCALLLVVGSAEAGDSAKKRPRITSAYTPLYPSKQCKQVGPDSDYQEGQDPLLRCPGKGGYRVEVSFAAVETLVAIRKAAHEIVLAGLIGEKISWRMANGKPFAVIVRVAGADLNEHGHPVELPETVRFSVRGLSGYESLNADVYVAKTPQAELRARELADQAFWARYDD